MFRIALQHFSVSIQNQQKQKQQTNKLLRQMKKAKKHGQLIKIGGRNEKKSTIITSTTLTQSIDGAFRRSSDRCIDRWFHKLQLLELPSRGHGTLIT